MQSIFQHGVNTTDEVVAILKQAQSDLSNIIKRWQTEGTSVDLQADHKRLLDLCMHCKIFLRKEDPDLYGRQSQRTAAHFTIY